ncbi:hypothetical protein C2S52_015647 [Perilla frutescens var. hirtella]|nr:hypothetical protein C2S52_015647 [Perilla frutescens var. hirtella]
MNVLKMDKGWTTHNRLSREYADRVESFLNFALRNSKDRNLIPCPCAKCANTSMMSVDIIRAHLFCHVLYCYSETIFENGRGIRFELSDDVFGSSLEIFIHFEDILPFCDLDPISENCVVAYIWHLYGKLKEKNHLARFTFVNPFSISYVPGSDRDEQARCLADRLANVSPKQLVLVPCNVGAINMFNANKGKKAKK